MKRLLIIFSIIFLVMVVIYSQDTRGDNKNNYYKKEFTLNLTQEEKEWLKNKKSIKVGINIDLIPLEFLDKNNKYSGIASSYLKQISKKIGIDFKIEDKNYWYEAIGKIKNKEIDMFACIANTKDRKEYMQFTKEYLSFPLVIVTRNKTIFIKNLEELSGKKVVLEKSFYSVELLKKQNPKIEIIEVNDTKEALKTVYEKKAYAYIGILPNVSILIQRLKLSNLAISGTLSYNLGISMSVRKDYIHLKNILQKALDSISQEEKDEIYNKWVKITYQKEIDYELLYKFVFFFLLIFLFFVMWLYVLNKEINKRKVLEIKLKNSNKKLAIKNRELEQLTLYDTLTKVSNRRRLDKCLNRELKNAKRYKTTFCVMMLDIDFFKSVNDNFGHKKGDEVLFSFAQMLRASLRETDIIGRWGGEEFLIIFPHSSLNDVEVYAKRVLKMLNTNKLLEESEDYITASMGIAEYKKEDSVDSIINRADKCLYYVKENGRNNYYK